MGSTVAVYDLGGGTFDAAVVRKTAGGGFELLGTPEGIDQLGGVDFDEAVFAHVRGALAAASNVPPPRSYTATVAPASTRSLLA
ncbi:MAG TPA: Hsp70 family protein [Pseudonocardia sp.]|nr:Hsp70 family protein [Pseudonocardia sp.]